MIVLFFMACEKEPDNIIPNKYVRNDQILIDE